MDEKSIPCFVILFLKTLTNFREYFRVVFTHDVRSDIIEQMFSVVRDIILFKKDDLYCGYNKANGNGFISFRTKRCNVNAIIKDETIWITQKAMAELFGVKVPAISKYLKNIFEDGELDEQVVISKMETPTPHGAITGKTQIIESDFDKIVKKIKANN